MSGIRFSLRSLLLVVFACGSVVLLWLHRRAWYPARTLCGYANRVEFTSDGTRIATDDGEAKVRVWDLATGKIVAAMQTGPTRLGGGWAEMRERLISISHDGTKLVTNIQNNLRIYGAANGVLLNELVNQEPSLWMVGNFGTTLPVFSSDGKSLIFDSKSFLVGPALSFISIADFKALLVGKWQPAIGCFFFDSDDARKRYDAELKALHARILSSPSLNQFAAQTKGMCLTRSVSAQGNVVATHLRETSVVQFWDACTLNKAGELQLTFEPDFRGLTISPDGTKLAIVERNVCAHLYDVVSAKWIADLGVPVDSSRFDNSISYSGDGAYLYVATTESEARIYETSSGTCTGALRLGFDPNILDFAASRVMAVKGGDTFSIHLWDARSGEPLTKISIPDDDDFKDARLSPDGERIVVLKGNATQIWERRRSERWYGMLQLPELWVAALFVALAAWSIRKDRRELRPQAVASSAEPRTTGKT